MRVIEKSTLPCLKGFPAGFGVTPARLVVRAGNMRGQKCVRSYRAKEYRMGPKKEQRKKRKKTALVICRDRREFWTTQTQFWQWVREGVVVKTGDRPLSGSFNKEHEELMVILSNTVLNLAHPNHLREALASR